MTDSLEPQFLVVGLPASGKTTFLAALQNYIDSDLPDKSIRMTRYCANSEYLNRIHNKWLQFEMQSRTIQEQASRIDVSMHIEVNKTGDNFTLNIPDVAGETFSQQWSERYWELEYHEIVCASHGLMVFVHPSKVESHAPIAQVISALGSLTNIEDAGIEDQSADNSQEIIAETEVWSAEKSPTQTVLVDLVQAHIDHISGHPIPVSILVSAWDLVRVGSPNITPSEWLRYNLPLLWQFLSSNFESLTFEVYGVSAQGGNFEDRVDLERLEKIDIPANRVLVASAVGDNNDIASPIISIYERWKAKQS